jgi:hypothetical protein
VSVDRVEQLEQSARAVEQVVARLTADLSRDPSFYEFRARHGVEVARRRYPIGENASGSRSAR